MTDCAVIFAIGSGADEPLSGSTIRLRRIEIGVKGDLEVLSAWKSYVLTGASMTIPLVQGVIYQARVLGAVDGEKIFRVPETTEVLYKDLVRVFPLPEGQNFGPQGLRGEVGPEGPAGPNSIPTDTFVASKVADPTSATGEAVAAKIPPLVIDARAAGIDTDGTDQSADLSTIITAALAAGLVSGKAIDIRLPLGTIVVSSALPTIDPTRAKITGYGQGATTIDASALAAGPLVTFAIPDANGTGRVTPLSDLTIKGPQARATAVDCISLNGSSTTTSAARLNFDKVTIDGFRYQLVYGSNSYLNTYRDCTFNHPRTAVVNYSGGITNSGENEQFINSVLSNGELGIYCAPNATTPNFTFIGTSFDYLDRAWLRSALGGSFNSFGCHWEAGYRTVQITTTAGSTTAAMSGGSFIASLDNGKLIADTSGNNTFLAAGTTFTVASTTSITLSTAAVSAGTFNAKINSRFYAHADISGAVQDFQTTIVGGSLAPVWDAECRTAFMGVTGSTAVQFGLSRTSIDGLSIATSTTATCKYLLWDESTAGGNGIQQKATDTVTIRNLAYTGIPKTAYTATWPLRYRDRANTQHILTAEHEHIIGKQVNGPAFRLPGFWETMNRAEAKDKFALTSGTVYLTRLVIEDGGFSQLSAASQRYYVELASAGTSVTQFVVALFYGLTSGPSGPWSATQLSLIQSSGNQSGSLTANAVNKWFASNTGNVSPFSEVWVGVLANATTPPEIFGRLHGAARPGLMHADFPLVAAKLTGQSSMPSTITRSALVASEFQPWALVNPTQT